MKKRFVFVGKSMLWSLLLYVTMMLAFNWDDVRTAWKGQRSAGIANSRHHNATNSIVAILNMLSGVSAVAN